MRVLNFNAAAAVLANKLVPIFRAARESVRRKVKPRRKEVTVDAFILATSVVSRADILYTTDPWFKKIVEREDLAIDVQSIPPLRPKQLTIQPPPPTEPEPASEQSPDADP